MFEERIRRLFKATGVHTDSELARKLKIQPPSVAGARKRQLLPGAWVEKIALDYNVSSDWLLFGCGPMHRGQVPAQNFSPNSTPESRAPTTAPPCPKCGELRRELELERAERRSLVEEVLRIAAENRSLWKENGNLREKCARLEERQNLHNNYNGGEAIDSPQ